MAVLRDNVAVLGSKDFGEYDKLIMLFGQRHGKFRVIAKSIRKLSSRKRGHLETFNLCKVSYAEGRSLDIVIEAESYYELDAKEIARDELDRVGFAGEVLNKFLPENVPDAELFKMWADYIIGKHANEATIRFLIDTLDHLGFVSAVERRQWISNDGKVNSEVHFKDVKLWVQRILDTM